MPADFARAVPSCSHMTAWLGTEPHLASPLDKAALKRTADALVEIGAACGRSGYQVEFRAALVKALAVATSAPVLHGSDDDVFVLTQRLHQDLYSEVMRLRRAVLRDIDAGVFHD